MDIHSDDAGYLKKNAVSPSLHPTPRATSKWVSIWVILFRLFCHEFIEQMDVIYAILSSHCMCLNGQVIDILILLALDCPRVNNDRQQNDIEGNVHSLIVTSPCLHTIVILAPEKCSTTETRNLIGRYRLKHASIRICMDNFHR